MELREYPEWEPAIRTLAQIEGTVMLVGGVDSGKTTFCTLLLNQAVATGRRVAVVDSDIGQSEIGPPACVGMGFADAPIRLLSDLEPAALSFVGGTAPRGNLMELAVAVRRMADAARARAPHLLLVDTTGYVSTPSARRLKDAKFTLLSPNHVVALQRSAECEPLLTPLRFAERVTVHRIPVPALIRPKPPALRAQRRAGRFAQHFREASLHEFDFGIVAIVGTWLTTGSPVAPHLLRFISSALGVRTFYAEEQDRHLGIMSDRLPAGEHGIALLQEQFRSQAISITPASRLHHLLCGLCDGEGKMLSLGLIESIDPRRRQVGVLTPVRAPSAIRLIRLGALRLRPDGTELGTIRPGEI